MDDLLREFLTETAEALGSLDVELVRLEQQPDSPDLIGSIFRLVHTIKGTCGFLELPRLETLAHAAENVLGRFRDRELEVTAAAVTLILRTLDQIKVILADLEQSGKEPAGEDEALIAELNDVADGRAVAAEPDAALIAQLDDVACGRAGAAEADAAEAVEIAPAQCCDMDAGREPEHPQPAAPETTSPVLAGADPAEAEEKRLPADANQRELSASAQTIRIGVNVLDGLMTTISELVLVRNQLLQMVRQQEDSEFTSPLQRLNQITSELQEDVMKTRMQPIGNAWQKLPRIVRDLSQGLGKRVELEMVGAETELDKQVLELIKDPLTHMIRNAVDHGLELPAERAVAGKPEAGRIRLEALHEGGHVIIRISDDGRGLSVARIREKIIRNGLASPAEVEAMSDAVVQSYIFKPGFSTAEQVTNVSGRGVGMDVVRSNVEKIGGTIEMSSVAGRGTTLTIKIPLTLAIVSALIVECGGQRFAVPQISVRELVRVSATSEHRIETIERTPVLRLRNHLLQLLSLRELLGLGEREDQSSEVFVIVSQVGARTFGIIVDRVFEAEEIVVKPVAPMLRDNPVFSGNTMLGDGSIVMILDPNGIASRRYEAGAADGRTLEAAATVVAADQERVPLLLFRAGGKAPKAVPLALVARLEEIEAAAIEQVEGRHVVQYRGCLMPLVTIDSSQSLGSRTRQPVVVFTDRDRAMGLVVDEILDIVEDRQELRLSGESGRGIMGTALIAGKATEVVDAGHFLTQAFPDWFGAGQAAHNVVDSRVRTKLDRDDLIHILSQTLSTMRDAA